MKYNGAVAVKNSAADTRLVIGNHTTFECQCCLRALVTAVIDATASTVGAVQRLVTADGAAFDGQRAMVADTSAVPRCAACDDTAVVIR